MPSQRTLRIYLVEDNTIIRQNLIATFEELAEVTTVGWADTERGAVDWLTRESASWDLAIVDLFLKQGNGVHIIEACADRRPDQRVIVLSNYATPSARAHCRSNGADAVFDKSTDVEAVLDYCGRFQAELAAAGG